MENITLKGKISKEIYRNSINNFCIYLFLDYETKDHIKLKGQLPELMIGSDYNITGYYENSPQYGQTFVVTSFTTSENVSKSSVISYLSSNLFEGIGIVKAEKIVDIVGVDCIDKIIQDPQILVDTKILSKIAAKRLQVELSAHKTNQQSHIELLALGLTTSLVTKLIKKYGMTAMQQIKNDPYKLSYDIDGIGFIKADEIALKSGISKDDILRIKACILYLMDKDAQSNGNTYFIFDQIKKLVYEYTRVYDANIELALQQLTIDKRIVKIDDKYFTKTIYDFETITANRILDILNSDTNDIRFNNFDYDSFLKKLSIDNNIEYTNSQIEAIKTSLRNNFTIITGGPGTGKTTIISAILNCYAKILDIDYDSLDSYISLMAPTGRASKRMKEILKLDATTIHKKLGYNYDKKFIKNIDNPLSSNLVIVDEVSMLDISLAKYLLSAIKNSSKVIFVGDVDQLPSVGPGQVLYDLISSNKIKTVYLKEIHRQTNESYEIIKLAHQINTSKVLLSDLKNSKSLFLLNTQDDNFTINTILDQVSKALSKGYDMISDIQILIPKYSGSIGIDNINNLIQNLYIKNKENYIKFFDKKFYLGDKIMQLENNPDKNVMNGDLGVVVGISKANNVSILEADFDGLLVRYEDIDLFQITLAYAMSIHKSQGSEYKLVILPINSQHKFMMKKQLLYTAVTRAKDILLIIGDLQLITYASKYNIEKRKTYLLNFLLDKKLSSIDNTNKLLDNIENEEDDDINITPFDFM